MTRGQHPARAAHTKTDGPSSAPRSGERSLAEIPASDRRSASPTEGATLRALRELRTKLAVGGVPPIERRTPEDEVRVAAFFVLAETIHIFDQFRRSVEQRQPCRLVVSEHGRQLGRVVVEIAIEGARG